MLPILPGYIQLPSYVHLFLDLCEIGTATRLYTILWKKISRASVLVSEEQGFESK